MLSTEILICFVQKPQWIPDYTLTAMTDTTYLKVRKNTYMVAVKATKMESSNNYPGWKEEEFDEVLVKITENDDDFCVRNSRHIVSGEASRRDSVWSTISIIKSKLGGGRSNNSFDNIREERFWEVVGNNNTQKSDHRSSSGSYHQLEV